MIGWSLRPQLWVELLISHVLPSLQGVMLAQEDCHNTLACRLLDVL